MSVTEQESIRKRDGNQGLLSATRKDDSPHGRAKYPLFHVKQNLYRTDLVVAAEGEACLSRDELHVGQNERLGPVR
jgi:hypothetical protein